MIRRRYFYNVRITIKDNNGSYSYQHGIATRTSWLEESISVLDEIVSDFMIKHREKVGNFEVVSFNKIN